MKMPRTLPKLQLCGNSLPWVDRIVHLGNTITNKTHKLESDMKIKNARYVSRNIELNQEFYFAAEETKLRVNEIYNSSWFGSVLWDLFSPAAVKLESSWNRSMKIMLDLPHATHRGLVEPLSGRRHLKRVLLKRFLKMVEQIEMSKKPLLRMLLKETRLKTTSTTGKNLREFMLITQKDSVEQIVMADTDTFPYFPLHPEEGWRTDQLLGIMEERTLHQLEDSELELFNFLCTD